MKRTPQDIIGDKGILQFESVRPQSWIYRRQPEKDIGIDGELEIIKDMASTGDIIKVQIKGTESPKYVDNNTRMSIEIDVSNAHYYCYELRMPVVIIGADLINTKTFWYFPQIDVDFRKKVKSAKKTGQREITVYLPVENSLPDTIGNFEQSYCSCRITLSTETIIRTQPIDFAKGIEGKIDYETVIRNFQDKTDVLKIEQVDTLIRNNNLIRAYQEIKVLLDNPQSSIQTKFAAYLSIEKISAHMVKQRLTSPRDDIKTRIGIAYKLKDITQKGPMELKYFAALLFKTAELNDLSITDYSLYMTWQVHQENVDSYIPGFYWHRKRIAEALRKKYVHCLRLLRKSFEAGYYYLLPECSYRIIEAMIHFHRRLKLEGLGEAARMYYEHLHSIIISNSELAIRLKQWDSVFAFSLCHLWLADRENAKDIQKSEKEALALTSKIEPKELRNYFIDRLNEIKEMLFQPLGEVSPAHAIELDMQIYRSMAEAMGIDLNDPKDPLTQVVKVGLIDYNPERVLKNCENLFVSLGGVGLVGEILKLPTAGMKILHCTLHHHRVGGISLDMLYNTFVMKYCKKCPDKKAHPANWHWTYEWQQQENEKNKDLLG